MSDVEPSLIRSDSIYILCQLPTVGSALYPFWMDWPLFPLVMCPPSASVAWNTEYKYIPYGHTLYTPDEVRSDSKKTILC